MPAKRLPWMKWYSKDAFSDVGLKMCRAESRGVWYDMLWLMDASPKRGYLTSDGVHPYSDEDLCRVMAVTPDELNRSKEDLLRHEVPSVDPATGIWFNRRMVADEHKRDLCGAAGSAGGGNPALTPPPSPPPNLEDSQKLICSERPIKVSGGVEGDKDEIFSKLTACPEFASITYEKYLHCRNCHPKAEPGKAVKRAIDDALARSHGLDDPGAFLKSRFSIEESASLRNEDNPKPGGRVFPSDIKAVIEIKRHEIESIRNTPKMINGYENPAYRTNRARMIELRTEIKELEAQLVNLVGGTQ